MKKHSEVSRRIGKLREARNETQAEFAEILAVTQPMVSAWESGADTPSLAAYLRLGNKASYPDNIWFWRQAGMDEEAVLSASKSLLKERSAPPAPGEIIRIPRFRETLQGRESAGPPIPLPAEFIPNPGSTVCLSVDKGATAIADSPWGIFILDDTEEKASNLLPFWGQVIFVGYDPRTGTEPRRGSGIYAGRLMIVHFWPHARDAQYHASARVFLLTDAMAERSLWIGNWAPRSLAGFGDIGAGPSDHRQDPAVMAARKELAERAQRELNLRPGWRILGRVRGRLKLEGYENG